MIERTQSTPVAIIGIGCLYPKAADTARFWANILDRVDVIGDVPPERWNPADYHDADPKKPDHTYARRGGFLEPTDFPPLDFGISPNSLEGIDATQLLGLLVARQALEDAGYGAGRDFDRNRTGVILGITGTQQLVIPLGARLGHPIWRKALKDAGVPADVAEDVVQRISDGYAPWIEDSFPGLLGNVAAGRIANRLDLGGTNCVVDAACASSLSAIHLGLLELSAGRTDMILTGGFDVFNDIFMYMCFSKTPALSPSGDARPFDRAADGTILGEGLGCVVLKRLADAERDGDKIYAVIKSIGTSSDGKGQAIYAPSPAGQKKALQRAYELAGVTPDTIELVEAHGTGTKAGDTAEVTALTEVYRAAGRAGSWCALGSVKSQLGHTKAAAGASGLIKAALALHHKVLPPTIKVSAPIEALQASPLYVNTEKRPWLPASHPRRAAVSAFGFGGSNFHCVLEEYRPEKAEIDWDGQVQLLAFSAESEAELWRQVDGLPTDQPWSELRRAAARSRQSFRAEHAHRLVLVLEHGKSDLPRLIDASRKLRGQKRGTLPDGACFAMGPVSGRLAMLFPGQGSQYVGMLRDLACQFPQMQRVLGEANDLGDGRRLGDFLYPQPVFNDEARQQQEAALRSTDIAQPALGAVSLGAMRVLDHFGVRADAFAGHSYGELVALCAAGRYDAATLHHVSRRRGSLMAQTSGGAMLAVAAPLARVEELLRQQALDLTIANKNAPSQVVLSGSEGEIARAADCCGQAGLRCVKLTVSAAFHSPLVAGARERFHEALAKVDFAASQTPVFANTTGLPYPADVDQARQLLANQLTAPVEFMTQVQNLYGSGVRTFVEVGPGNKLTGLVSSILEQQDHVAIALDASSGRRGGDFDLARLLAQLAVLGHPVALERWDAGVDVEVIAKKPALTVPISGGNYVRPRPSRPPVERPLISANHQETMAPHRNGTTTEKPAPRHEPPPIVKDHAAKAVQDNLLALQKLGEQTARLHAQFLDGQDRALQVMQGLLGRLGEPGALATGVRPIVPAAFETTAPVVAARVVDVPVVDACTPVAHAPGSPSDAADAADSPIAETLLAVVAEKTGYPVDTLQLDMELDADLGIDSIKRVEIFSAIQDQLPQAPAIKPEHLGTLRTLRQVAEFLGRPGDAAPAAPAAVNGKHPAPATPARETTAVAPVLLATVSEKTGYPVDTLQLDMELDADLGIDSIKRVEIFSAIQDQLPHAPAIKPEHLGTLRTLRQVAEFLAGTCCPPIEQVPPAKREGEAPAEPARQVGPRDAAPPVRQEPRPADLQRFVVTSGELPGRRGRLRLDGDIWVTRDDTGLAEGVAARLETLGFPARLIEPDALPAPERLAGLVIIASTRMDPRSAFRIVQRCGPALRKAKPSTLVTVSRLDGVFGIQGLAGDGNPLSGGLAGLTKTAAQEWPEVHCKALDVAADRCDLEEVALAIAEEICLDGPVEVGLSATGRTTLHLQPVPLPERSGALPFVPGDVVVVTGGGRGVTAETALALARACQPTLVLLGRTPAPGPEPDWLIPLATESEIKQALAVRANGQGTPRKIEEQYRLLAASRELRDNLRRIEAAGGKVSYRSVDVGDAEAVRQALADIRRTHGPIRGLIHGAGVLADRRIEDKTLEQFDQVFGTKVPGLQAMLADLSVDELKALAFFSSITARRGRAGQVDYAVANEVLNKLAQREARRRPACKVVSLNWGPWDGGMVTPGLKRVFQQEGIGLIPLDQGADHLLRELSAPAGPVEVVVLAPEPKAPVATNGTAVHTAFERTISVADLPILRSHVIGNRAVVPMALIVEWLAHGAMHQMPGLQFAGLDELRVLKGIRLDEGESERIRVQAGKASRDPVGYHVPVELHGLRGDGRDLLHASATVLLTERLPANQERCPALIGEAADLTTAELYDTILFHGPDLQGIETVETCSPQGISGWVRSGSLPKEWVRQPPRGAWIAEPLVLDCAFQLMTAWCRRTQGAGSLPCRAGRYRQYRRAFPTDGVRVVCRVTRVAGPQVEADLWFLDSAGGVIARLDGYECVLDPSLNQAFRQNRLEAGHQPEALATGQPFASPQR